MKHPTLQELLEMKEDLHPDLVPYLYDGRFGKGIHHPLVIEIIYRPEMNALTNLRYKHMVEQRDKAKAEGRWGTYVFTHERPYRLGALVDAMPEIDQQMFQDLVSDVWVDSENIYQHQEIWNHIWKKIADAGARVSMTEDELKALDALPNEIDVWRGTNFKKSARGLSWTTDKDRAIWFANRFKRPKGRALLVHGRVKKKDVLAHFLGRNENEIVAKKVDIKQIETLK